jgi:hypothetical protein
MKKQTKILTAEEQYPELEEIARFVELTTLCEISKEKRRLLRTKRGTKCPYPAQCILEMVIKKLERNV